MSLIKDQLMEKFFDIGVVQINFEKGWIMKSGMWSPIYINLRMLQSYPDVLQASVHCMKEYIAEKKLTFDVIASVPMAAIALGIVLSAVENKPHITPRMDSKTHGLGVKIDGAFTPGMKALLIDDLITQSTSKMEAIKELEGAGLVVSDVLVVLDRQQGGTEELENHGYHLHALFTLKELLHVLAEKGKITEEVEKKIYDYLETSKK